MSATRISTLVAVAVSVGAIVWYLLRLAYEDLPPLPWTMVPTLLLLGAVELMSAMNIRARVRRQRGAPPIEPLRVARMVSVAKASAYAAALFAGGFAGVLAYVLPSLDIEAFQRDAFVSGSTLGSAVLFGAAALFLEHACRVPRPPDEGERGWDRRGGDPLRRP
ncbi:MAG: DUF3180 domain-containing protein [Streptosporangiaceae bacterium]